MKLKICMCICLILSINVVAQVHSTTSKYKSYKGLVMTGYQGWFGTPDDGATNSWRHYNGKNGFKPGSASIEYWPDMREADEDEKAITQFTQPDGSPAYVFSSANPKTVNRHFKWMKEYGIDGAFQQRFTSDFGMRSTINKVMKNSLDGARNNERAIAVMYDISNNIYAGGYEKDKVDSVRTNRVNSLANDFKYLVDSLGLTTGGSDQTYLYHNGKPLVALWGFGFPHRHGSEAGLDVEYWAELIQFFKEDSIYGGCAIMAGVPTHWRTGGNDCIAGAEHQKMLEVLKTVDIIMPWHTSRFSREQMCFTYFNIVKDDVTWCNDNNVDYVPTISPGIREIVLHGNGYEKKRENGYYFWDMTRAALEAGVEMLYLGMFDEVDEGTQFCKIDNTPPFNTVFQQFATYQENPPDHYLWLAGEVKKHLVEDQLLPRTIPQRADSITFLSEVHILNSDSGFNIALKEEIVGRKVYFADPYLVSDGAPTLNSTRNSEFFNNPLTETPTYFSNNYLNKYFRIVEVDAQTDTVLSFYSLTATELLTSYEELDNNQFPESINLYQNYPNPFNPDTNISFSIPSSAKDYLITLKIFDSLGREVSSLFDGKLNSGIHSISFNADLLSSGVYYYRLAAGDFVETKKMVVVR